jgi:hypothetical protein
VGAHPPTRRETQALGWSGWVSWRGAGGGGSAEVRRGFERTPWTPVVFEPHGETCSSPRPLKTTRRAAKLATRCSNRCGLLKHCAQTMQCWNSNAGTAMLKQQCSKVVTQCSNRCSNPAARARRAGRRRGRHARRVPLLRVQRAPGARVQRRELSAPSRLGRLSGLSVCLCKSVLYGDFAWARRALDSQKRRFPARAVGNQYDERHCVNSCSLSFTPHGACSRGRYVITHRSQSKRAQRYIRLPLFHDAFR